MAKIPKPLLRKHPANADSSSKNIRQTPIHPAEKHPANADIGESSVGRVLDEAMLR
jgi:hypothetical protein